MARVKVSVEHLSVRVSTGFLARVDEWVVRFGVCRSYIIRALVGDVRGLSKEQSEVLHLFFRSHVLKGTAMYTECVCDRCNRKLEANEYREYMQPPWKRRNDRTDEAVCASCLVRLLDELHKEQFMVSRKNPELMRKVMRRLIDEARNEKPREIEVPASEAV